MTGSNAELASVRAQSVLLRRIQNVNDLVAAFDQRTFNWVRSQIIDLYGRSIGALLYGSHVNGDVDQYSDYDVLVVGGCDARDHHELRKAGDAILDVHVSNVKELKNTLLQEQRSRTCFCIKSISESLVICDNNGVSEIRDFAREVYTDRRPFAGWGRLKVTLNAQLRVFYRERSALETHLYYAELVAMALRIISLSYVGWMARADVMLEWIKETSPEAADVLQSCCEEAVAGDPAGLYELCVQLARSIHGSLTSFGDYS